MGTVALDLVVSSLSSWACATSRRSSVGKPGVSWARKFSRASSMPVPHYSPGEFSSPGPHCTRRDPVPSSAGSVPDLCTDVWASLRTAQLADGPGRQRAAPPNCGEVCEPYIQRRAPFERARRPVLSVSRSYDTARARRTRARRDRAGAACHYGSSLSRSRLLISPSCRRHRAAQRVERPPSVAQLGDRAPGAQVARAAAAVAHHPRHRRRRGS